MYAALIDRVIQISLAVVLSVIANGMTCYESHMC